MLLTVKGEEISPEDTGFTAGVDRKFRLASMAFSSLKTRDTAAYKVPSHWIQAKTVTGTELPPQASLGQP